MDSLVPKIKDLAEFTKRNWTDRNAVVDDCLTAMLADRYEQPWRQVIAKFLIHSRDWKGPNAQRAKKELASLIR